MKSCPDVIILHGTQVGISVCCRSCVFSVVCVCLPWGSCTPRCWHQGTFPVHAKALHGNTILCGAFFLVFSLVVKIFVKTLHLLLRGYFLPQFSMMIFPICPFLHPNYLTDFGFLLKILKIQNIIQTVIRVCFTQNSSVSADIICKLVV